MLDGSVTVESNDIWGNRTILSHVGKGQFFAETYALLEDEVLLVDVRANENCRVRFFTIGSLKNLRQINETKTDIGERLRSPPMACYNKKVRKGCKTFRVRSSYQQRKEAAE